MEIENMEIENMEEKPFNKSYTQKDCMETGLKLKHKFYAACDKDNGNGSKHYYSFVDVDGFFNYFNRLANDNDKNFYEIIPPNQPRYQYFDIDVCKDDGDDDKKEWFEKGKVEVLNAFLDQYCNHSNYNEEDKKNILITDSSNNNKISFHIIDKNFLIDNLSQQLKYIREFEDEMKPTILHDKNVYTPYRLMRIVGNTKRGKNSFLIPYENHEPSRNAEYKEFIITEIDDDEGYMDTPTYNNLYKPSFQKNNNKITRKKVVDGLTPEQLLDVMKEMATTSFPNWYDDYNDCYKSICIFRNSFDIYGGDLDEWKYNCRKFCKLSQNYNYEYVEEKWNSASNYNGDNKISIGTYFKQYVESAGIYSFLEMKQKYGINLNTEECCKSVEYEYESDYNFSTFQKDILRKCPFKDFKSLLNYVIENLNRVCVLVPFGKLKFYVKNSDKYLKEVEVNFKVGYTDEKNLKQKYINFADFVERNISYFKIYEKVGMMPLGAGTPRINDIIFNTWLGYNNDLFKEDVEINMKYVDPFLLLVKNMTGKNEKMYNYFLAFFQHLIKHPYIKIETQLVITGHQGTGKTLIMKVISSMMHQSHVIQTSDLDYIVGQFNSIVENCVLAVMNDVVDYTAAKSKLWGKLKSLATDTGTVGRKMYSDPSMMTSYVNFVFTSNNDTPTKVEESDRRNVMTEFIETKLDPKIYKFIDEEIAHKKNNRDHLFNYLYRLELNVNLRAIPETKARKDAMENAKHIENHFYQYLKTEINSSYMFQDENGSKCIYSANIWGLFVLWCGSTGHTKGFLTDRKLIKKLKHIGLGESRRIKGRDQAYYNLDNPFKESD